MKKLTFSIRVDGQLVTNFVKTTRTRNIIALEFSRDMYTSNLQAKAIDYEVCMNAPKHVNKDDEGE